MARFAGNVQGVVVQMTRLAWSFSGPVDDGKLDVDRGVCAVLILDLGLGQGGLRARAPKDRLHRFVNQPAFDKDGEGAQDFGFVGRVHR